MYSIYLKNICDISANVLGICEVPTAVGIWASDSEPHILLLSDPDRGKVKAPQSSNARYDYISNPYSSLALFLNHFTKFGNVSSLIISRTSMK